MATTTYMSLVLPTVSVTVGPVYATQQNTAMDVIDAHDHTTGKGVQIPTSGLNINANLQFNSNAAIELSFLGLETQGSAPSTVKSIYVDATNDLYYKNGSGTLVQITSGSAVASSGSGVITYAAITSTPYSVTTGDAQKVLGVNTSTAKTLNLPSASNVMFFQVKDVTGSAATNNITINPNGADTIEGISSLVINETYAARSLMSDGVSKYLYVFGTPLITPPFRSFLYIKYSSCNRDFFSLFSIFAAYILFVFLFCAIYTLPNAPDPISSNKK